MGWRLKAHDPSIQVLAAEPEYGDLVYGLRNLDEGFVPPIWDADVLDGRIKVDSGNALCVTRELVEREGVLGLTASAGHLHCLACVQP